jgi:hypothetical protein
VRLLGADRIENSFPYNVVTFLRVVSTERRIEVAVLLSLELLRNLATECLVRNCLRGNLFTNPLPGNALTCHSMFYNPHIQFQMLVFKKSLDIAVYHLYKCIFVTLLLNMKQKLPL